MLSPPYWFRNPYWISGYSGMRHPHSDDFSASASSLHWKYNSVLSQNEALAFSFFSSALFRSCCIRIMLTVLTRSPTFIGISTDKMDGGTSQITPRRCQKQHFKISRHTLRQIQIVHIRQTMSADQNAASKFRGTGKGIDAVLHTEATVNP